jgi:hypothetical protein
VTDPLAPLRAALTDLAAALADGDSEALLAVEAPIAEATARLQALDPASLPVGPQARADLAAIFHLIDRCRTLGASSAALLAHLTPGEYGPAAAAGPLLTPGRGR